MTCCRPYRGADERFVVPVTGQIALRRAPSFTYGNPMVGTDRPYFVDPISQCVCTVHATSRATIGRTTSTQTNAEGIATWYAFITFSM